MLPVPTRTAVAAFAGLVALVAVGLAAQSAAAVVMAAGGLLGLALVLAATVPLGRRVRHQRLEFAWWLDQGAEAASGAVVPGAPFEVRCYVRHRGDAGLRIADLSPIIPPGAQILDDPRAAIAVDARSRTEFTLRLVAPAAGRIVLHGLAVSLAGPLGLFEVPLYFPNPLAIKVLPRAGAPRKSRARTAVGQPTARAGRTLLRRRGGGTELYELRELLPGDPFKSIAWKASARTGRLMVKEVEREVQETVWVVLDVSGTMRGGAPGLRKLDYAIELAAAESRRALEEGDRIGLITVDQRVLAKVPPGDGAPQMIRVYDSLLAATEVVDADLTDVEDEQVLRIVARYVRQQDGVDFARSSGVIDVAGLVVHLERALADDPRREDVQAPTVGGRIARRFCRARGIPLPYRPAPRDGSKAPALAEALRLAGGRSRVPSRILVVTDFDGVVRPEPLVASVDLVRAHGHSVAFVMPDGPSFLPEGKDQLGDDLRRVFSLGESRRAREARQLLGRRGVPVVVARRGEPPGLALTLTERSRVA